MFAFNFFYSGTIYVATKKMHTGPGDGSASWFITFIPIKQRAPCSLLCIILTFVISVWGAAVG